MKEPLFKLFGETADKVVDAIEEGKNIIYKADNVEGRTVVKVYVE